MFGLCFEFASLLAPFKGLVYVLGFGLSRRVWLVCIGLCIGIGFLALGVVFLGLFVTYVWAWLLV